MDGKSFEWMRADINRMATAFRQLEKMNTAILSNFGESTCRVYILLEQLVLKAEDKIDFRNKIEKEIIQSRKKSFFQKGRLSANEIYLLEDYLKQNFNPLDEITESTRARQKTVDIPKYKRKGITNSVK